jgi:uncharacterized protein (TIGR03435 family)
MTFLETINGNLVSIKWIGGVHSMKRIGKVMLFSAASAFAVFPLLSQTPPKPSFEVISIKPTAPGPNFIRGGAPRGDRFDFTGANLRMLLQVSYGRLGNNTLGGQLQIFGGPTWMDSERYDIQAKADCSGGKLSREQTQLMMQSLLEERFQLKAHTETRELPIYNLVVAKDGPKLKASADQTPPPLASGPPQPCDPESANRIPPPPPGGGGGRGGFPDINNLPRGAMVMMMSPTGMTMATNGAAIGNLVNFLSQQVGRPVVDKTDLKGLFDFKLTFSPEGIQTPFGGLPPPGGGPAPGGLNTSPNATDPNPSLFTAIQELGLRLESTKGPVEVLVVDSVQKPTGN